MTLPSDDYRRTVRDQVGTVLPQTTGGAHVQAVYPKSFSDIAANGMSDSATEPRLALIYSTAEDCQFSISRNGVAPFCPIPSGVLLLIHIPTGEKIKVSKASRVVWL